MLPAAFPNLLANGSQGIAVGMATWIPPHNAAELCDAALYLINHPKATSTQLTSSCRVRTSLPAASSSSGDPSPRPTAPAAAPSASAPAGRRRNRPRHLDRRHRDPLPGAEGRLIEKIAELLQEKKLPLLADVRDESAEDVRVVLEPSSARSIRSS